ncbi:protein SPMIP7 [Brachyhypopomus gauderio]|uniref:protein SPMIP7 n=1 Tax=Brachyhypopomus gauderio TaxID=698409 RepID=UPI0040426F27
MDLARPPASSAPLAPLRDLVPLIDPCCGQISAGAKVDLRMQDRCRFIDGVYVPSDLWVPAGARERPQTPPTRPSAVMCDASDDKCWNSRSRARREIFEAGSTQIPPAAQTLDRGSRPSVLSDWIKMASKRYIYTSTAQRSYEDINWDSKIPPRIKPPSTTLEKMADPVKQHFSLKRYHARPESWQSIGPHWNRQQVRATYNMKKPISFTSPCTKLDQIPLYCGVVGSEDMDSVDRPEQDFRPLTRLRTTLPPYTPTAHRPTMPGYTGKAVHDRPHTAMCLPSPPSAPHTTGSSSTPSFYGRKGPLSRMVTTVPPCNPYLHR